MKKCIACRNKLKLFGIKDRYAIYKCISCGLGHTQDLQPQQGEYHRDTVYIQEQKLFANLFQRRINIINKYKRQPGRILEIGSSTGLMLSLFKKEGWEVTGVEISSSSAEFAIKRGIRTIKKPFEKNNFGDEKFDVVIINHTLEHLADPVTVIRKINQILNDDGILLIDVPNFGSFSARFLKMRWALLLPGEHLWHFTIQSLSIILANNNKFDVIYKSMPSGIFDFGNPVQELVTALVGFKKRFFMEAVSLIPSLIMTKMNIGTNLTVVARKGLE